MISEENELPEKFKEVMHRAFKDCDEFYNEIRDIPISKVKDLTNIIKLFKSNISNENEQSYIIDGKRVFNLADIKEVQKKYNE